MTDPALWPTVLSFCGRSSTDLNQSATLMAHTNSQPTHLDYTPQSWRRVPHSLSVTSFGMTGCPTGRTGAAPCGQVWALCTCTSGCSQSPSLTLKGQTLAPVCRQDTQLPGASLPSGKGGTSPWSHGSCNLHASAAAQHGACQKQECSHTESLWLWTSWYSAPKQDKNIDREALAHPPPNLVLLQLLGQ